MRAVQEPEQHDDDYNYLFGIGDEIATDVNVSVDIGGVRTEVLIESGASMNVVDPKLWEKMKAQNVRCKTELSEKPKTRKPLTVAGRLTAEVSLLSVKTIADFYVVEEPAKAFLGKETAKEHKVCDLRPIAGHLGWSYSVYHRHILL